MSLHIGIDVGVTGAITILNDNKVEIIDMPIITTRTSKTSTRRSYDIPAMVELMRSLHRTPVMVTIEDPGKYAKSSLALASLREGFGAWVAICTALQYPVDIVKPGIWKKVMLAGKLPDGAKGSDKKAILAAVRLQFPELVSEYFRHEKYDRAESLYIALYGKLRWGEYGATRRIGTSTAAHLEGDGESA